MNIYFDKLIVLLNDKEIPPKKARKIIREILGEVCYEKLKDSNLSFGNRFIQLDYLCKKHNLNRQIKYDIQTVRRNCQDATSYSDKNVLAYDVKSLVHFISILFKIDIPYDLLSILPKDNHNTPKIENSNFKHIRGVIDNFDNSFIHITADSEKAKRDFVIDYVSKTDFSYLRKILRKGLQINVLDSSITNDVLYPQYIILEPDFLIDISVLAGCFNEYGHHPYNYLMNFFQSKAISQPILLGNFAGAALDDIIHTDKSQKYNYAETIKKLFKDKALEFSTCLQFDGSQFKIDANSQASNLVDTVNVLRSKYDMSKALLEPSFVCERLGIQGRVDLMTYDFKLLIEQKSGKNFHIDRGIGQEKHIAQVLMYYGVLLYNFNKNENDIDVMLLYSKYAIPQSLVVQKFSSHIQYVSDFPSLYEIMKTRNEVVSLIIYISENGFNKIIDHISPNVLNTRNSTSVLYRNFLLPDIIKVTNAFKLLSPIERLYVSRLCQFIFKEQITSKIGGVSDLLYGRTDVLNMPVEKKIETGNIYIGLTLTKKEMSSDKSRGYDLLTFAIPEYEDEFLPNFRIGDMVYAYTYDDANPCVCKSFLYSCTIIFLSDTEVKVLLGDGQENPDVLNTTIHFDELTGTTSEYNAKKPLFAIEHAIADTSTKSSLKGLFDFATTNRKRRDLIMGISTPTKSNNGTLIYKYDINDDDNYYDDIIRKFKQANDYFLLIGPPGSGKTHRAIKYMITEELAKQDSNIILMAYTNRAVDEICSMLTDELGVEYLRMGKKFGCDEKYRHSLISNLFQNQNNVKLDDIKEKLSNSRIVVGTVAYLSSKPFIFSLKHFSLAIIDEASQLLETDLLPILSSHQNEKYNDDIDKFVLVGDYKQMPAVVSQSSSDSKVNDEDLISIGLTNCRNSLFQRLVNTEKKNNRQDFIAVLNRQGRMHKDIAQFPNMMFYKNENMQLVPCVHQIEEGDIYKSKYNSILDNILNKHRYIFFDCKNESNEIETANIEEARLTANILKCIYLYYGKEFDKDRTIGVIVPFRNQIAMVKKAISEMDLEEGLEVIKNITIDTVERFQGSQRDVIIYSFTVSKSYQLDFLTANSFTEGVDIIDPKLNVALTRARRQMIIMGNSKILSSNSVFKSLIEYTKDKGSFFINDKSLYC